MKNGASIAVGLGADVNGHSRFNVNLGVRKIFMPASTFDGGKHLNPWVAAAGIGLKF
ncbi:MAG: hypothetical protein ACHP7N_02620 [Caulobacterales bacterium]